MGLRHLGQRWEQLLTIGEVAITAGARQKARAVIWQASPFLVDVALAIIDQRDHGGFGQHRFRSLTALHPAVGFLLLDRQLLIVLCLALGPAPHLGINQPKAFLILRVNGQDRMREQPDIGAIADRAEPPLAPALRLIVDLARILNGEDVPARRRRRDKRRPMRDHFRDRDARIAKKAPKPHLFGAIIRKLANADFLPLDHPLQHQIAVFSQPVVAKISDPRVHHRSLPNRDGAMDSNQIYLLVNAHHSTESHCNIRDSHCNICAQASPTGER